MEYKIKMTCNCGEEISITENKATSVYHCGPKNILFNESVLMTCPVCGNTQTILKGKEAPPKCNKCFGYIWNIERISKEEIKQEKENPEDNKSKKVDEPKDDSDKEKIKENEPKENDQKKDKPETIKRKRG